MSVVVDDATVLIYFAKLGEFSLLRDLFETTLVPEAVYDEVIERGRAEGYRDALAVREAIDGDIEVVDVPDGPARSADRLRESADLGRGEAAAIALARYRDARCLTDDHAARTTATSIGVDVGGTIYVLLKALEEGHRNYDEYVGLVDELADSGFRMSASLYRRAVEVGEAFDPDD